MRRVGSCSPRFRSTCYHCDENVVDDNSWQLCSVPFAFVRFEFIGIRVFAFVPSMTVRCPPKKMSDYSSRPCRTTFIQLPRRRMDLLQFDFNLIPLTTRPSFLSCLNLTTGLRNSECRLFFFSYQFCHRACVWILYFFLWTPCRTIAEVELFIRFSKLPIATNAGFSSRKSKLPVVIMLRLLHFFTLCLRL